MALALDSGGGQTVALRAGRRRCRRPTGWLSVRGGGDHGEANDHSSPHMPREPDRLDLAQLARVAERNTEAKLAHVNAAHLARSDRADATLRRVIEDTERQTEAQPEAMASELTLEQLNSEHVARSDRAEARLRRLAEAAERATAARLERLERANTARQARSDAALRSVAEAPLRRAEAMLRRARPIPTSVSRSVAAAPCPAARRRVVRTPRRARRRAVRRRARSPGRPRPSDPGPDLAESGGRR
jgi:hypothetical protein